MSFANLLILLVTTSAQLIGIVSFANVADEKVEAKAEFCAIVVFCISPL